MWSMSNLPDSAVSWCTITSGSADATAWATASGSKASATTGRAPRLRTRSSLSALLVIPTTSWPRATSCGTSSLPRTPVAPATKTFMTAPLVLICPVRRDRGAACDSAQHSGLGAARSMAARVHHRPPVCSSLLGTVSFGPRAAPRPAEMDPSARTHGSVERSAAGQRTRVGSRQRRGRDSNPRTRSTPVTRFPIVPVQPLRHPSRAGSGKGSAAPGPLELEVAAPQHRHGVARAGHAVDLDLLRADHEVDVDGARVQPRLVALVDREGIGVPQRDVARRVLVEQGVEEHRV